MASPHEFKPDELRCLCDPKMFSFKDTSQIETLDQVIGQERAVQAIDFGLDMDSPGYNIFVTGIEGTGKSTIVRDIVTRFAKERANPNGWCLVNNFKDAYRPRPIAVSPGQGVLFSRRMNRLVSDLKNELPRAFEHNDFLEKQTKIQNRHTKRRETVLKKLEDSARRKNLQISRTKTGYQAIPVVKDKPLTPEDFRCYYLQRE